MKVFRIKLLTFILVLGLIPLVNCKKKNDSKGWEKTFGGKEGDWGYSIQQTKDGGFIIAGLTRSFGPYSIYLLKVDGSGNFQEQWTFGVSDMDHAYAVRQTQDGGYIITGWFCPVGVSGQDIFLIKTDSFGNRQWQKPYGWIGMDEGYSVQEIKDGGYVIVGRTYSFSSFGSDIYLAKTNESGELQWQKTFGSENSSDFGYSVVETQDSGYVVTGTIGFGNPYSRGDVYLFKTDKYGNLQWEKNFGDSNFDQGRCVQKTSDNGYIITGYTYSFNAGEADVYLIKTDSDGNLQWQKTFGGAKFDHGNSVQQTQDNGYVIVGGTESFGAGGYDVYLIKTDENGNLLWEKTFGGKENDWGECIQEINDGSLIMVGGTGSFDAGDGDVYLIKTDANGNVE